MRNLVAYIETGCLSAIELLGLSERMTRNLVQDWVAEGWLIVANPSRRKRAYQLSTIYRQYMGSLSAASVKKLNLTYQSPL